MNSQELIRLQRLPFKERLEEQYATYQKAVKEGHLMGREGHAPVDTTMKYEDLQGNESAPLLIFGSNSYLGLAYDPYVLKKVREAVEKYGIGSGGSPAFSGYTRQHKVLEERLAALAGHEDAVLLPGGYMANLCWINGLMNRNDIILYDKYSHASVYNAIKMAGVRFYPYDPENLPEYEALLKKIIAEKADNAQLFSTVEGVRSIDGSVIQLKEYFDICKNYDVFTVLDDAHGLGTLGKYGRGTLEHLDLIGEADMRMSTCSKAIGAQGAFLSGDRKCIFYLRNFASPYVFTTALAQPTIAAISAGLDILENEPKRLEHFHANVRYMQDRLTDEGFNIYRGDAGIIPVFLPDGVATKFNRTLHKKGLFANIMEYPMVPPGLERLRLSIMATHTKEQMDRAIQIIKETAMELGVFE